MFLRNKKKYLRCLFAKLALNIVPPDSIIMDELYAKKLEMFSEGRELIFLSYDMSDERMTPQLYCSNWISFCKLNAHELAFLSEPYQIYCSSVSVQDLNLSDKSCVPICWLPICLAYS